MEINDYCKGVNTELMGWKTRLHDVISKIEHLPTGDKQRMYEEVNGLYIFMAELEERIERLQCECSTEWRTDPTKVSYNVKGLSSRYNGNTGIHFDYDFGG